MEKNNGTRRTESLLPEAFPGLQYTKIVLAELHWKILERSLDSLARLKGAAS